MVIYFLLHWRAHASNPAGNARNSAILMDFKRAACFKMPLRHETRRLHFLTISIFSLVVKDREVLPLGASVRLADTPNRFPFLLFILRPFLRVTVFPVRDSDFDIKAFVPGASSFCDSCPLACSWLDFDSAAEPSVRLPSTSAEGTTCPGALGFDTTISAASSAFGEFTSGLVASGVAACFSPFTGADCSGLGVATC